MAEMRLDDILGGSGGERELAASESSAQPPSRFANILTNIGNVLPAVARGLNRGIRGEGGTAVVEELEETERTGRQRDRQAALDFLGFHQQLSKIPPGPEKNYMIDQLGEYAQKLTGQPLPKGYIQTIKRQNQEQQAKFATFLEGTVKKYNLGLTEGLLPLLTQRPDLLVETVGKELDFQRRQAITEREKRDEGLRARLLGQLEGGQPDATGFTLGQVVSPQDAEALIQQRTAPGATPQQAPAPSPSGGQGADATGLRLGEVVSPEQVQSLAARLGQRPGITPQGAQAVAQEAQRGQQAITQGQGRAPLQGPSVEVTGGAPQRAPQQVTAADRRLAQGPGGQALRDKLDQRIQALDAVLRQGLPALGPGETNEKFRTNLEQELARVQGQRDRLVTQEAREEDVGFRRQERAEAKQGRQEELAFRRQIAAEERAERKARRAEERETRGLTTETQEILRAQGIARPTPEQISAAVDEKRTMQAHIQAQNQRAAAEIQSERVDPVQSRQLGSLSVLLGHVKALEQFTPQELKDWVGPIEGRVQRLEQLKEKDPRYQAFLGTLGRARAALLFSRTDGGGGALTPTEFKVLEDFNVSTTQLDGAIGFATNLKQIKRDIEGKVRAGGAFAGVQRGQVYDRAKEVSDSISQQSIEDIGSITETFGGKGGRAPGPGQGRVRAMSPADIVKMDDAAFDALTTDDIQGLSGAQYGALRTRAQKREGKK